MGKTEGTPEGRTGVQTIKNQIKQNISNYSPAIYVVAEHGYFNDLLLFF